MRSARAAGLLAALALAAASCGGGGGARPSELTVFAAASLAGPFTALEGALARKLPGVRVTWNFAGSQVLAAQLEQGARADVLATADTATMERVAELVTEPRVLARNQLQIVVEPGNPKGVRGLADLARPDLKVVLAAEAVPVGRYARQALAAAGVTVRPASLEQDVKAVVAKVALGEADAGIAYATDVTAAGGRVEGVRFPEAAGVPATYLIAVVREAPRRAAAEAFVELALSPAGQRVLERAGFLPAAAR